MVAHSRSTHIADKMILLVVARAHELPLCWVRIITNGPEDHVISLLNSAESYVFHSLNERKSSSVCLSGLFLEMHVQSTSMVNVVAGPELHAKSPSD